MLGPFSVTLREVGSGSRDQQPRAQALKTLLMLAASLASIVSIRSEGHDESVSERTCIGTSPTGIEWTYLQPKHTGTGGARRIIGDATGVNCLHAHDYKRPPVPPQHKFNHPLGGFGFTLLRNPFKRVLSNCFFKEIVRSLSNPSIPPTTNTHPTRRALLSRCFLITICTCVCVCVCMFLYPQPWA